MPKLITCCEFRDTVETVPCHLMSEETDKLLKDHHEDCLYCQEWLAYGAFQGFATIEEENANFQ